MPCVERMPLRVRCSLTWQSAEPDLRSRGDSRRPWLADYTALSHRVLCIDRAGAPPCRGGGRFQLLAERSAQVFLGYGEFRVKECSRRYAAALVVYGYPKRRKSVL